MLILSSVILSGAAASFGEATAQSKDLDSHDTVSGLRHL